MAREISSVKYPSVNGLEVLKFFQPNFIGKTLKTVKKFKPERVGILTWILHWREGLIIIPYAAAAAAFVH